MNTKLIRLAGLYIVLAERCLLQAQQPATLRA